jgi:hypothetical protein
LTIVGANALDLARSELSETAEIPKLGADGQLQVREVWNGVAAETIRVMSERLPREQIIKSIGDAKERQFPGARLMGDPEIRDDRVNNVISLTALYNVPKPAAFGNSDRSTQYLPLPLRG